MTRGEFIGKKSIHKQDNFIFRNILVYWLTILSVTATRVVFLTQTLMSSPSPEAGTPWPRGGWPPCLCTQRLAGSGTYPLWLWEGVSMRVLASKTELRRGFDFLVISNVHLSNVRLSLSPEAGMELFFWTAQNSSVTMFGGLWLGLCPRRCIAWERRPLTTGCCFSVIRYFSINVNDSILRWNYRIFLVRFYPWWRLRVQSGDWRVDRDKNDDGAKTQAWSVSCVICGLWPVVQLKK